ncbi:MAG: fumarate hydratase [Bacteriovoracaceae bacterium]|nr:fumarate hydratase [Bacteriovoracaceae bacterium]
MAKKKATKKAVSKKVAKKKVAKKAAKKKVAKKKATKKVAKKATKKKVAKKAAKKKVAKKATKKKVVKKATKKKVAKKATKKKVAKKATKKVAKKAKKVAKKATKQVKKVVKKATQKVSKDQGVDKKALFNSILELIKNTSTVIPDDVQKVILEGLAREEKNTTAEYAMNIITNNIEIAKKKIQPLCQDTGTIIFYVDVPKGFVQSDFTKICHKAVVKATEMGYLRQNSVDSLTGENKGMNIGPGHPSIHFHEHNKKTIDMRLMLKAGGCENVGAQYAMPYNELGAGRDLAGVRKVILDAVQKAQGKGCGPGVLGVCIGGDRGAGYTHSKEQLFRKLDDTNEVEVLADLEKDIVETANKLGIGPMGFGGKTTLMGCKIGTLNRLPASYYVSISYMCWAFRRQGVALKNDGSINKWLY